jgi:hypothetical protein
VALFRAKLKEGASLDWEYAHGWLKTETQDDYSKRRERFFDFYNKLPKEKKAEFAQAADFFRKQYKQTVYSYSLPSK